MKSIFPFQTFAGLATGGALLAGLSANAQLATNSATYNVGLSIGDNNLSGLSDTRTFAALIGAITDVNVTLNISGGFNGDFYAYLTHDSGFSVLLNRPGRTAVNTFGYPDSGFSVTFDDSAASDIHTYRLSFNPNGGALTGDWQPDGRNIHPGMSLDTSSRDAMLSSFNGLNPNGEWTIFIADASPVGSGALQSWSLQVVGNAVPEPGAFLLFLTGIGTLLFWARKRK